jgi:hypothetical protein
VEARNTFDFGSRERKRHPPIAYVLPRAPANLQSAHGRKSPSEARSAAKSAICRGIWWRRRESNPSRKPDNNLEFRAVYPPSGFIPAVHRVSMNPRSSKRAWRSLGT